MSNKEWTDTIIKKVDPSFKHRWILFDEEVTKLLTPDVVWVDCGCGTNGMVNTFGNRTKSAIGVDLIDPEGIDGNYIKADIKAMPFPDEYADLITLRFVVEHFDNVEDNFSELERVLKPNGKIVILTTNYLSPLIRIPHLILPYRIKNWMLSTLFKVDATDIFPTYHKVNVPNFYQNKLNTFTTKKLMMISDLNSTRKSIFLIFLSYHILTLFKPLNKFRTNILAVLEKNT
ncbi:MAG: class I SAM-dependent methyltransferase [Balneolaceae bacterium]